MEEVWTSLKKTCSSWFHILQMPPGLRDTFCVDEKPTPTPTPCEQLWGLPPPTNKGKERERQEEQPLPVALAQKGPKETSSLRNDTQVRHKLTIWMGQDTLFKSANSWFVEPGRSNRPCQEGTSSSQTLPQDILVGIATLQSMFAPPRPVEWKGRETPPHFPLRGRGAWSTRERDPSPQSRQLSPEDQRDIPSIQQVPHHAQRNNVGSPSGDDDDGDS